MTSCKNCSSRIVWHLDIGDMKKSWRASKMTVKELIELLKQQNQDAVVYFDNDGVYLQASEVESYTLKTKDDAILISYKK